MKKLMLLAVSGMLASTGLVAEIYKCTDAGGNINYSDKPCHGESVVFTPAPGPKADENLEQRRDKTQRLLRAYDEERSRKQKDLAEQDAEKEMRAKNCRIARERYAFASRYPRLYRDGPDGERIHLMGKERDAAIAGEKAAIEAWCN